MLSWGLSFCQILFARIWAQPFPRRSTFPNKQCKKEGVLSFPLYGEYRKPEGSVQFNITTQVLYGAVE